MWKKRKASYAERWARNSIGVLSRLAGRRVMFMSIKWLCQGTIQACWKHSNTRDENQDFENPASLVYLYTPHPQSKQLSLTCLCYCVVDEENCRGYISNVS